jgi:adenylylsulfate kinase
MFGVGCWLLDVSNFFPMTKIPITAAERAVRHGHTGLIVWFTGLSGSGKTTLSTALEHELFAQNKLVYLLDGDILRTGLCRDLGFSAADRHENVRRAGEVARVLADAGFIVLAAFISPFRKERDDIRAAMPAGKFIEVFVNAPLATCESRDVKGLYKKARANQIPEFTGISSPYEIPLQPELDLHTERDSIADCVQKLCAAVEAHLQK